MSQKNSNMSHIDVLVVWMYTVYEYHIPLSTNVLKTWNIVHFTCTKTNIQTINSVRFWWKIPYVMVFTAWRSILCLVHSALRTIFIRMYYEKHNMIKHANRAMGMCLAFPKDGCKIFNRVLNWNFNGFCSHQDIDLAQLDRDGRPAC